MVDQLVRDGWTRTDPPGGVPAWYVRNESAADPRWSCLTPTGGPWHPLKSEEYPSKSCGGRAEEQIVLTAERGPRVFVARFGPSGLTVDAAHKRDEEGVAAIRRTAVPGDY
ncbi:hypothetical protein GCM10009547_29060 [Sporichthya brevicatena]|uniref:Uncharacterized protein n=1 Tax=Sporichthya brevicatena TaxID=171442 RepID=A0ABN1GZ25_9ACTN